MTRDQFISIFFIALLVFVVYEIFHIFSPFFRAIFWAAILVFAFYPLYTKLKRALKPRDTLAAAAMTIVIFLIVIPPCILIVTHFTGQAVELYQSASNYVGEGRLEELVQKIRSFGIVRSIEAQVFQWEPLKRDVGDWILSTARSVGSFATAQASTFTRNILLVTLNVLLTFTLVFVFLKDGEKIYRFIYQIAPLEKESKKSVFGQINETFAAVFRGQLLTALVQAVLAAAIFWVLGLPVPIFFAAVTFLTSMIPVLGASFVWLPLVLYLLVLEQNTKALVLFIFGALVISLVDNLLKPALIGEKTKLPYFLLLFGILGGMKLYGLMGIFIAPVVLSLFFALVKIYEEKYL